ncbi:Protein SET [Orchesella cincta]|uniref:Protein SET n=1 Tax=Orchesella cincta TaxID=48709 RepID=A0A1D2M6S1_ORCCI|nr:Protein SET [Orchesella cincta]
MRVKVTKFLFREDEYGGPSPHEGATRQALSDIDECHKELDELNGVQRDPQVETKYNKLRKPYYDKRAAVIEKIPNFWVNAIVNHPQISMLVDEEEEDCLNFLKKLEVEEFENGFRVKFIFDENPFFDNGELIKEFQLGPNSELINELHTEPKSTSTIIKWKENMDLSKKQPQIIDANRKRGLEQKTFFSWFSDNKNPAADDIAEVIKDDFWSNPLQYFVSSDENVIDEEKPAVLRLLPEIWDSILPFLNVAEFQSLINSDLRFGSVLESEKNNKLLPLVLPIVLKNCGMSKPSELLCWRGVNKTAKSIVDNLLEESSSPDNYLDPSDIYSPLWTPSFGNAEEDLRLVIERINFRYQFNSLPRLQHFVHYLASLAAVPLANPFLSKSLFLNDFLFDFPWGWREDSPSQLVMPMLQQVGHHISSVSFKYIEETSAVSYFFTILKQLPNLKILKIRAPGPFDLEPHDLTEWVNQVRLDQLEVLDVNDVYNEDGEGNSQMALILACVGPQLRTFSCKGDFFTQNSYLEQLRRFQNLRTLRVNWVNRIFLHRFSNLGFQLPLEEIQLHYSDLEENEHLLSFGEVYRSLRDFASTLIHLKIVLRLAAGDDVDNLVAFPNVSTFTIQWKCSREGWFPNFIQQQTPQLTELNLLHFVNNEPSLEEVIGSVQLLRLFENAPSLQKINICSRFDADPHLNSEEFAKKVVMQRVGTIRTIRTLHTKSHFHQLQLLEKAHVFGGLFRSLPFAQLAEAINGGAAEEEICARDGAK